MYDCPVSNVMEMKNINRERPTKREKIYVKFEKERKYC